MHLIYCYLELSKQLQFPVLEFEASPVLGVELPLEVASPDFEPDPELLIN